MKKWNMTINYTIHWAELDDSQILKLYESKDKVKTLKPMEGEIGTITGMIK
jgi:transposase